MLSKKKYAAIDKMNALGKIGKPFFFIFDFELKKIIVHTLDELEGKNIFFEIRDRYTKNAPTEKNLPHFFLKKYPEVFEVYQQKFQKIISGINYGNSFLANLTCVTPIEINLSLKEIFAFSEAKYKLLYKNKFVCFSPETFVKISNGKISTFPMKGTIDADLPDADLIILNDAKEKAEHNTIVDLLRNDLGSICEKVWIEKFRYIDKITTQNGALLQMSSEICGVLPQNYPQQIGTLLLRLLPAGSICGAPKVATLQLIKSVEGYERGFYTGIAGIFDGKNLDSCVLIRFIERTPQGFVFKSGGGITSQSDALSEYAEMIQKIYLPIL